jgi:alanine racemase
LAGLVGGIARGDVEVVGHGVATDSRAGVRPGDVFFGLVGPHFDGGVFARDALAEGATIAVVRPGACEPTPGRAVVEVDDPLAALQALAAVARRSFQGVVVAVTGSNGKTATKDLLARALGGARAVSVSPMSYNSQVGVALSLLHLDPSADVAVIECGISRVGEMERLAAMVRPDVGVLVNVGDAHLEGLGTRAVTAAEKARLFRGARVVVVPTSEALARDAVESVGAPMILVGTPPWEVAPGAVLRTPSGLVRLGVDPSSDVWVTDAALAAATAAHLGVPPDVVSAGLDGWQPPPMRLEQLVTPRGVLLLNDAYTADPESVDGALRALVRGGDGRLTVAVLGGMAQLGPAREAAHARVGRRLVALGVGRVIGVGDGGGEIVAAALAAGLDPAHAVVVGAPADAAPIIEQWTRSGDRVLLKASRYERLERVAEELFGGLASARLTVDLDAVVENLRAIRRVVGRDVGVLAVVKSFGYGLDGARIASALQAAGVSFFSVAYPDEGVALRDAGVTRPILVHNVLPLEVGKVVGRGLSAEVWSEETIVALAAEAERQQRPVRVHLKVDSGMGRAGCVPGDAPRLAASIRDSRWLRLDGLMTHFASSEDPAADDDTRAQIAVFRGALAAVTEVAGRPRWVHACNSAAIARFPEAHFDMVRAGLGLLGYVRVGGAPLEGQRPVLRLVTRVVSVRELPPGQAVGYNATWSTGDAPATVAVVALGYGDGYPWSLSNRGWMVVRGVRCPVVGRVSMDVTTLDVSAAPGVRAGDEVVVFGPGDGEPELEQLAAAAGTIPYELLTRLTSRVRRVYLGSR